jgi:transposase
VGELLKRLGFTWKKRRQVAREKDLEKKDKWIGTTRERAREN